MAADRTGSLAAAPVVVGPASGELEKPQAHDGSVTRDRFDVIVQHCADLGIPIEWEDLGPKRRGKCQVATGRIVLNPRMTVAQTTATLSHEVGHWEFGDLRSTPSNERRAWEFGASLVISSQEYRRAERLVGHHLSALAIELSVTPKLIEAWRAWWGHRGHRLHDESEDSG